MAEGTGHFSEKADRLWRRMVFIPFCFMGMGIFRVWTETLYTNSLWVFPAQTVIHPLPFLDAYSLFDLTAAVVLIVLALFAKRIAPFYRHTPVIIVTAVSMVGCACLNFCSLVFPWYASALSWPALILGGVGIAFILMLWSEFFSCINPLRVAVYYSISITVGAAILWVFKDLSFGWLMFGTCAVPVASLLCLWRSYAKLPRDAFPPVYQGSFSFPWKPIIVVGLFSFAYGMRSSIFSGVLAMNSGLGAFVGAFGIYLAITIYRSSFDFSMLWKTAMPLMLVSLVPLEMVFPWWQAVADFCALASYTIMLILIMVILSNLSYRYGVCALWVFAIERAVRLLSAQTGRVLGNMHLISESTSAHFIMAAALAALLVFAATFFFSEKQLTSPWGVVLRENFAANKEEYLEKNRLGTKCRELAKAYNLTAREEEILLMISRHKHLNEISDELFIGTNTVKTHVRHIYQKLDVHSRNEALELLGVK